MLDPLPAREYRLLVCEVTDLQTPAVSVAARLDRLPIVRAHWVATGVIGLGLFFDLYENFLAATISSVLRTDLDLAGPS